MPAPEVLPGPGQPQALVDVEQEYGDEPRLPVVALNNVRLLAGLVQEFQYGPGEEDETIRLETPIGTVTLAAEDVVELQGVRYLTETAIEDKLASPVEFDEGTFALGIDLALSPATASRFRHPSSYFFGAFFLPATARRGPLRVRALVCVRCPLTGRPRRCRRPR